LQKSSCHKKLFNRTSIILILNLFLGLLWLFSVDNITDLINDDDTDFIQVTFFATGAGWNFTLILDKKKNKN